MSETAVKKSGKIKNYAEKKYNSVKNYGKRYKEDIRTAYDLGYSKGWEDAYKVPKRFGSTSVAAYGYKNGIKNRYKSDKYVKQYARKS